MHGAVVGKTFGRDRFGAVLGLMRPAMFPIQILGVPFAGWIFDVTGSYDVAFQVFLGLYLLAALAVSFYRQPENGYLNEPTICPEAKPSGLAKSVISAAEFGAT